MGASHFVLVGRCGHVIAQCRCPDPNKARRQSEELCPACKTHGIIPGEPIEDRDATRCTCPPGWAGRHHWTCSSRRLEPPLAGINHRLEQVAAELHKQWADYMAYHLGKLDRVLFATDGQLASGDRVARAAYVNALEQLIRTPYAELPPEQQENDRAEARKILAILENTE